MYKLRQTWNDVFPQMKLYAIDVQISLLDPAWPVTAKPPSSSIHVNPKFFKNTSSSSLNTKAEAEANKLIPRPVDKETLLMQEQLIQKQKELLELQQKKLELEVLQTQVKLREQITQGRPQNILLKPEVAKQLVPTLSHQKQSGTNASLLQQQKSQTVPTNGTKINPVSSALINARPVRDPRLMRQQQKQPQRGQQQPTTTVATTTTPATAPDGNADGQLHQRTLIENNKIVTNKVGVRKTRNDPRLINKDEASTQKTNTSKSAKSSNSKSHKSSRSSSQRSGGTASDSSSNKSTSNSLDISKSKTDSVKTQSPSKSKKKDKSDDKRPASPSPREHKRERSSVTKSPTSFKGIKSLKNRNYVRRNIGSTSPEIAAQDEDLRSYGPPEKQQRLLHGDPLVEPSKNVFDSLLLFHSQVAKEDSEFRGGYRACTLNLDCRLNSTILSNFNWFCFTVNAQNVAESAAKGMDVDFRQLPAAVGKKRSSTDAPESTVGHKKTKFDKLFGDEDTDLRKMSVNAEPRPKTPPPPIISSTAAPKTDSPKSNLDAVRAKLANATNRDKVMAISFNKKKMRLEDQDLRQPITISPEATQKIIISPEDESNIKSGNMTSEESKKLLTKIILQMEKNKLKEAKRKENVTSQVASDEEILDSDEDRRRSAVEPSIINEDSLMAFNDKDERVMPGAVPPPPSQGDFVGRFFPREDREVRRYPSPNNWRGGRGGRGWDNQHSRGPGRHWNTWKNPPYGHNNFDEVHVQDDENILTADIPNEDEIKTIPIDGVLRDIRYYGETAIAFIDWDDPRDLNFHDGVRQITFNDKESYMLSFNEPYKEITVDGKPHLVRLGAPTREVFIDRVPYECMFGSGGIRVELDGVPTKVQLDGPVPQVNIGKAKRTDLVAGKINLIINAMVVVPVFLDAKVQKFVLDNETSTLKFVDALKTVLINDVPFTVEYGGLPKPFIIHGKKHFIRFSVLPKGIKPGRVQIIDMEGEGSISPRIDENSQDSMTPSDAYDPGMPIAGMLDNKPVGNESPDRNSNSPNFIQKLLQQQQNNLDVLSNSIISPSKPLPVTGGYQCENDQGSQSLPVAQTAAPLPAPAININDLFQKLVASGFVTSSSEPKKLNEPAQAPAPPLAKKKEPTPPPPVPKLQIPTTKAPSLNLNFQIPKVKRNPCANMKPITFDRPESLRVRQSALYHTLYSGMQCSSCGMRFSPEASMQYSQHLDWHFRQNRKGKRNSRIATSRKWYYSLSDWKNYEELEDLEEREKNYFDQLQQAENGGDDAEEEVEAPSVAADPDSTLECCKVCHDKFDQFFHEEKEEWHLKNAIRVDGYTYHPLCYDDYLQSLNEQAAEESIVKAPEEPEKERQRDDETAIPGLEIVIDDDDEEMQEPPKPDEAQSLESEESKVQETVDKEPEESAKEEEEEDGDDDDVILNEVAPIKIVVDDDDDEPEKESNPTPPPPRRMTEDDGFVEIAGLVSLPNGKHVKIKAEPIDKDLDDIPSTPVLPEEPTMIVDIEGSNSTHSSRDLMASIDGNVDVACSIASTVSGAGLGGNKIKINISKPLPVITKEKEPLLGIDVPSETYIDPFEPFPPGEEPEPVTLKPALKGIRLAKAPPVRKGTELTGLCSIM
ncbi:unnamed protein product [Phyllotreta striolata]|nr:unnamed protein product [Phyllotreta striolata]